METKINWKAIDWEQSSQDIAKQTGAKTRNVYKARKRHAPHTLGKYIPSVINKETRWSNIDWSKTNREISDRTGYSMVTVNRARIRALKAKTHNQN